MGGFRITCRDLPDPHRRPETTAPRVMPSGCGPMSTAENSPVRVRTAISISPASIHTPLHPGHTSREASPTGRLAIAWPSRGHAKVDAPPAYSRMSRSTTGSFDALVISPRSNHAPWHVGHTSRSNRPRPVPCVVTVSAPSRGHRIGLASLPDERFAQRAFRYLVHPTGRTRQSSSLVFRGVQRVDQDVRPVEFPLLHLAVLVLRTRVLEVESNEEEARGPQMVREERRAVPVREAAKVVDSPERA